MHMSSCLGQPEDLVDIILQDAEQRPQVHHIIPIPSDLRQRSDLAGCLYEHLFRIGLGDVKQTARHVATHVIGQIHDKYLSGMFPQLPDDTVSRPEARGLLQALQLTIAHRDELHRKLGRLEALYR